MNSNKILQFDNSSESAKAYIAGEADPYGEECYRSIDIDLYKEPKQNTMFLTQVDYPVGEVCIALAGEQILKLHALLTEWTKITGSVSV